MLLWGKRISSEEQQTVSTPVWYARRTVLATLEGTSFSLKDASTQFEKNDSLLVIPLKERRIATDPSLWATVTVSKTFGDEGMGLYDYEVEVESGSLQSGEVLLILNVKHIFESDEEFKAFGDDDVVEFAYVPMPIEFVSDEDTKYELYVRGFRHPGWYRWIGYKEPYRDGYVLRHKAELLVSLRSLRLIDAIANVGNFSERFIEFNESIANSDDGEGGSTADADKGNTSAFSGVSNITEPEEDTGTKMNSIAEIAQSAEVIDPETKGSLAGDGGSSNVPEIILS